jgi:aryl-alcohol dehydrogenase-like predicted oxidoreductase
MGLVSEQSLYNLLVRDIELEVVPAAERYGLGIIPWSPLQGCLLGGVIQKENTGVRRLEGRAARAWSSIGMRFRPTRTWRRRSVWNPARWAWPGYLPGPQSPHRSSVRELVTSWTAPCLLWS